MILEVLKKYLGKLVSNAGGAILQFVEEELLQLLVAVGDKAKEELSLRGSPVVADASVKINSVVAAKVVASVDKISDRDDK